MLGKCGFSAAVVADNRHKLALVYVERYAVNRVNMQLRVGFLGIRKAHVFY